MHRRQKKGWLSATVLLLGLGIAPRAHATIVSNIPAPSSSQQLYCPSTAGSCIPACCAGGACIGGAQTCEYNCGCYWQTCTTTYTPARYVGFSAGDVAVNTTPSSPTFFQQLVAAIVSNLVGGSGPQYVHTKILYDATGTDFTETFAEGMPPSSHTTGEPNVCSKPISPFFLARMSPGAGTYYEDAMPGVIVKGFGTAGCNVPADGYHINSFLHDSVPGGSCEKELVDYCGVPVSKTADRTVYGASQGFGAVNSAFNGVYSDCMTTINGMWPWNGIGCGGTSAEVACQRVAWEVINEMVYSARPLLVNAAWDGGWSDFNVQGPPPNPNGPFPPPNYQATTGTMLGAGKLNEEGMPTGGLCPGACNNGGCNNAPLSCPGSGYEPPSFTANIPQNIITAAKRLGKTQVTVAVGSGIAGGYFTTTCH